MDNNPIIIDRHMHVENEEDLEDFLYDMIEKNHKNEYLDIQVKQDPKYENEELISGYLNNVYFEVTFTPKRYMALRLGGIGTKEEIILKRILQLVMWNIDENSKAPLIHNGEIDTIFTAPIYEVDFPDYDMHEVVWDTYDPEDSLKEILFQKHILEANVQNLDIFHPLFDEDELVSHLKVGEYPACLDERFIELLDTKTEFEMYLFILGKRKEITDLYKEYEESGSSECQEDLIIKGYQLEYLIQKAAKMFGIKVNPPANDIVELTPEFIAWEKWWADGMQNALLNQETFNQVMMGKYGYNPTFRPQGSYKDLILKEKNTSDVKDADVKEK